MIGIHRRRCTVSVHYHVPTAYIAGVHHCHLSHRFSCINNCLNKHVLCRQLRLLLLVQNSSRHQTIEFEVAALVDAVVPVNLPVLYDQPDVRRLVEGQDDRDVCLSHQMTVGVVVGRRGHSHVVLSVQRVVEVLHHSNSPQTNFAVSRRGLSRLMAP